jgi:Fe-S-cluster containining protein
MGCLWKPHFTARDAPGYDVIKVTPLHQIQQEIDRRTAAIVSAHSDWPCRKGCDDCCRSLASSPRITEAEWRPIAAAIEAMPEATAAEVRRRVRDSAGATRPVVCPLLDTTNGACLVYSVRPIACRAYGFYAERDLVLGCGRIETIGRERADVVWGNHEALEARTQSLGPSAELDAWLG